MKTIVLPLNCLASANGPLLLIKKGEMFRSRCSWWTRRSRVTSTSRALIFPPPTGRAEKLFVDKPKTDQSCCCFISPDSSCVDMEEEKEVTETRSTKEEMRKKWKKKKKIHFFYWSFFFVKRQPSGLVVGLTTLVRVPCGNSWPSLSSPYFYFLRAPPTEEMEDWFKAAITRATPLGVRFNPER